MKPLVSVLDTLQNSNLVLIPLDKTYAIACFLLRHSAELPSNVNCMVSYLKQLVSNLQAYFKCSGEHLVEKLKTISAKTEKELAMVSRHMIIIVQAIFQSMFRSRLFSTNFLNVSSSSVKSTKTDCNFNPNVSPLLQMI